MTEVEILRKFSYKSQIEGIFEVMAQAIYTKRMSSLNLKKCHTDIEEIFEWMPIKIRFDELDDRANNGLILGNAGFELYGHVFQTLDEVEKAINNKAFL